jgi:hypothetical protein
MTGFGIFLPLVIAVSLVGGCGDADSGVDRAATPLPQSTPLSFRLLEVTAGSEDVEVPGSEPTHLVIRNGAPPLINLWSPCRFTIGRQADISSDQIVVAELELDESYRQGDCTPDQLTATEAIASLLLSDPRYSYDGEQLRLESDADAALLELVEEQTPTGG